ncbi:hypothetical protein C0993_010395 [Termitomyces sp. T159_Od127]|nr:hypothetical protein C0993_010395 [Termitomyces sp. T159_Od127]
MSEGTLLKTRETLDAIRENARAEVLRISQEALGRTEDPRLRQLDARLAEFKERCTVLQEGKKQAEEALSDSRKTQETQRLALERANSQYMELEAKMHGALKEMADELSKAEVKLASSKEQLEARETMLTRSLQEKRDEIEVLKEKLHNTEVTVLGSKAQEASLKQSLKEKIDEIEAATKEGKTKETELHKAEVKIVALQEQLKAQEVVQKQTLGRYGDLQKASATLAADLTSTQNALEEARQEVLQRAQDSTKLVKLFECIEADRVKVQEESLRRAKEEEERVRVENERVTELMLVVERLEGEKRLLLERTGRLRERYDRNELVG